MMSNKSRGIILMLALAGLIITIVMWQYTNNETTICCANTHGWQMDTLYHPTNPNIFRVSLHYYDEIEYYIDTVEVIEEDGIRWYTLDTIQYESIDTTILKYPWGREEIYYFKYKEDE